MKLVYDNTEVEQINFNGTPLTQLTYNDQLVFEQAGFYDDNGNLIEAITSTDCGTDGSGIKSLSGYSTATKVIMPFKYTSVSGASISQENLFNGNSVVKEIKWVDALPYKVTSLSSICYNCTALQSIDFSGLDTSELTNINTAFRGVGAKRLDLSMLNTSNVTKMYGVFTQANQLEYLNIKNFDTHKVTNMQYMFTGCSSLTTLIIGGDNDTEPQPLIIANAFNNCPSGLRIYVPDHLVSAYKTATNWSTYASKIVGQSTLINDMSIQSYDMASINE